MKDLEERISKKEHELEIYENIEDLRWKAHEVRSGLALYSLPRVLISIVKTMRLGFGDTARNIEDMEDTREKTYELMNDFGVSVKYNEYRVFFKDFLRDPRDKFGRSNKWLNIMLYSGSVSEVWHNTGFVYKDCDFLENKMNKETGNYEKSSVYIRKLKKELNELRAQRPKVQLPSNVWVAYRRRSIL